LSVRDTSTELATGPHMPQPSPYWGDEPIWKSKTNVHNPMMDENGKVWITAAVRPADNPDFCKEGSDHPSAKLFPLDKSYRHLGYYDPETKKLTGGRMDDVPGIAGKIYASNITKDVEKGIGIYTDGELAYLLRTGIARDGKLMPFMQKPNLSDNDLKLIIAFLHSDDELVAPSGIEKGSTKYSVLGKMGISQSKPLEWPTNKIAEPDPLNKVDIGRYLIDNLSCYDCHSKSFMSVNKLYPEKSKGYMGGGNKLKDRSKKTIVSSNLTPHSTGIGNWTVDDFKKALNQGISKDNSIITFPMPMYSELTDEEITAIYNYLRTIPPIDNKISKK